jgi:hypothetical protein
MEAQQPTHRGISQLLVHFAGRIEGDAAICTENERPRESENVEKGSNTLAGIKFAKLRALLAWFPRP